MQAGGRPRCMIRSNALLVIIMHKTGPFTNSGVSKFVKLEIVINVLNMNHNNALGCHYIASAAPTPGGCVHVWEGHINPGGPAGRAPMQSRGEERGPGRSSEHGLLPPSAVQVVTGTRGAAQRRGPGALAQKPSRPCPQTQPGRRKGGRAAETWAVTGPRGAAQGGLQSAPTQSKVRGGAATATPTAPPPMRHTGCRWPQRRGPGRPPSPLATGGRGPSSRPAGRPSRRPRGPAREARGPRGAAQGGLQARSRQGGGARAASGPRDASDRPEPAAEVALHAALPACPQRQEGGARAAGGPWDASSQPATGPIQPPSRAAFHAALPVCPQRWEGGARTAGWRDGPRPAALATPAREARGDLIGAVK